MKKYKILYHGFIYVEAENEIEALDKAGDGEAVYEEKQWEPAEEVSDFLIQI